MVMKAILFGGTGFIGQEICCYFLEKGMEVYAASRSSSKHVTFGTRITYQLHSLQELFENMRDDYLILNLAGESIHSGRWTEKRKHRILESRMQTTNAIVKAIAEVSNKPKLLMNASAIGYYGHSDEQTFQENDPPGEDFLADVSTRWEQASLPAQLHTRVVLLRLGVVLGKHGGALPRMVLPYRFGIGGRIGRGTQWVSWVHLHDVARICHYCWQNDAIAGPVNVTAPHPVTMNEFGKSIAHVAKRLHWIPLPEIALRIGLGEMSEIILEGQRVLPKKLLDSGYEFLYPSLDIALKDLLHK
ncbi:TIGR01777 family oxidoreductase [Fodinisporobacter ferrooxydans]|uniref:TIGR01777 family oxidoreductase n=1 Tax=Fodinisporobacter ferrooxydans TaxID=2901836 RepID=A0ABY4CGQ0_9BACL|nr:TIGR01777 family oxidoreductase [Alicyclobacillaceae bacterium MYW30-H2]